LQLSEAELYTYTVCDGPFTSGCAESAHCSTTTTPEPTSTTTTPPPQIYCCDPGTGCACQEGECNPYVYCSGPHTNLTACQEVCGSTTTTTCNPNADCSSGGCGLICQSQPSGPAIWELANLCGSFGNPTYCDCVWTQEMADNVGKPCGFGDPPINGGGCCNSCEGATTYACPPMPTTTTPTP
jgi:hypothetical protein